MLAVASFQCPVTNKDGESKLTEVIFSHLCEDQSRHE